MGLRGRTSKRWECLCTLRVAHTPNFGTTANAISAHVSQPVVPALRAVDAPSRPQMHALAAPPEGAYVVHGTCGMLPARGRIYIIMIHVACCPPPPPPRGRVCRV
eukprot:361697-Chlamydomonas_euryale.AAC.4